MVSDIAQPIASTKSPVPHGNINAPMINVNPEIRALSWEIFRFLVSFNSPLKSAIPPIITRSMCECPLSCGQEFIRNKKGTLHQPVSL